MTCAHESVQCLNEYEPIRKYSCDACDGVMMCACDREIGERFLAHQLREGCVLETQLRVPVTLGFVEGVCRECRDIPAEAHPKAPIPGHTSKIRRYYWREIMFESFVPFADRAIAAGLDPNSPFSPAAQGLRKEVEAEVVVALLQRHRINPKYDYREASQAEVIERHNVEEVRLNATFAPKSSEEGARLLDGAEFVTAEEFASRHYQRNGWDTLFVESVPFHVLFGIYMWPLIQDATDPMNRLVSFGTRTDFEGPRTGAQIHTLLPTDFGTSGYAKRRSVLIDAHFDSGIHRDLGRLFDVWLGPSANLREYLWAHRESDVQRARQIVTILSADVVFRILRYLVGNYFGRHTGWPDLLIYKDDAFCFVEVKASRDGLSEDQKRWIMDNADGLHLPFKLVKIHRTATAVT